MALWADTERYRASPFPVPHGRRPFSYCAQSGGRCGPRTRLYRFGGRLLCALHYWQARRRAEGEDW